MTAAITKIKQAEDASDAALKKAAEQAQEIIRAGQATARERGKKIRDGTRKEKEDILGKARAEAEAACAPLAEEAESAIQKILKPDSVSFNSAVEALVQKLA